MLAVAVHRMIIVPVCLMAVGVMSRVAFSDLVAVTMTVTVVLMAIVVVMLMAVGSGHGGPGGR